jgi:hypothetical protein
MVYPPATSEAGARRPAIIQLEQFKEASSKPAQLYGFSIRLAGKDWKDFQSCFYKTLRIKINTHQNDALLLENVN